MYSLLRFTTLLMFCIAFTAFAESVSIQYGDNLTWNGELGQTISVEYKDRSEIKQIEGEITKVKKDYVYVGGELIFITDIITIKGENVEISAPSTNEINEKEEDSNSNSKPPTIQTVEGNLPMGVFMLPMEGTVGETMRATELKELAEYIDANYPPGQIIVLKVDSGGGYGRTWSDIKDAIFDVRENHRVVAWLESAISAAAMTVYCCDEIYYTSMGEVGSCTGYSGHPNNPLSPAGQQIMIDEMEKVIARSSRTPYLAAPMFLLDVWLSYDKDPLTGEITYYPSDEGAHILSEGKNLTLSARQALDAELCDGIADNEEELLALLKLEGTTINRHGEELYKNWEKTIKEFKDSIEEVYNQYMNGDPRATTQKRLINSQIKAGEQLLKWSEKLGEVALYNRLDEETVKRIKMEIRNLERQLQNLDD